VKVPKRERATAQSSPLEWDPEPPESPEPESDRPEPESEPLEPLPSPDPEAEELDAVVGTVVPGVPDT
jgi:hypothetical protein